jgi:hypothetical protein
MGHTHHGQQGQLLPLRRAFVVAVCCLLTGGPGEAQGVRSRTRPTEVTKLTEAQAADLTLTVSTASARPIQSWIRTAGTVDGSGRMLAATLSGADAALVKVGQRVRAFPPSSKSSMYQARITRVAPRPGGVSVDAALALAGHDRSPLYVMEIVVERGPFLSVPNEALIEEGDHRIVYVQQSPGQYVPKVVQTGIQGELYTQILEGLKDGEEVVTFGSFFIDAEQKLKGSGPATTAAAR